MEDAGGHDSLSAIVDQGYEPDDRVARSEVLINAAPPEFWFAMTLARSGRSRGRAERTTITSASVERAAAADREAGVYREAVQTMFGLAAGSRGASLGNVSLARVMGPPLRQLHGTTLGSSASAA